MSATTAVMPSASPASPTFRPPVRHVRDTPAGTVIGVVQPGAARVTEARLLWPLNRAPLANGAQARMLAEIVRAALAQATGGTAISRVQATADNVIVSVRTLDETFAQVATTIERTLSSSELFDERGVRNARNRLVDQYAAPDHPVALARREFLGALFGEHPRATVGSASIARQVSAEQLIALLASSNTAQRQVAIVGPGPRDELLRTGPRLLPSHTDAPPRPQPDRAPPVTGPVRVLRRPGLPQALIRLGAHVPGRADPDYPALQLAVLMLGGYLNGRLGRVLRDREGLAYAPRAVLDPHGDAAALTLEVDLRPDGVQRALRSIRAELDSLCAGRFSAAELHSAQNYAVGSMAMACSSRSGLASSLIAIAASGLPVTWLDEYERRLRDVSMADVARVAEAHLRADKLTGAILVPEASGPCHWSEPAGSSLGGGW